MPDQPATRPAETQRARRGHEFSPPADQSATIPAFYATEDTPVGDTVLHLRDQRDTTHAIEQLTKQLTEAGVAVIGEPPYDEKTIRRLDHLRHDGQPLTPESPRRLPGARRLRHAVLG